MNRRWRLMACLYVVACGATPASPPEAGSPVLDAADDLTQPCVLCVDAYYPGCVNLECDRVNCGDGGATTSISGVVTDPTGMPLNGVLVVVPNTTMAPVAHGANCHACFGVSTIVSEALTDVQGRFTVVNAPATTNVPLVVQIGAWRRYIELPKVLPCVDNPVAPSLTRLPTKPLEGSPFDDIPSIAVATGGGDAVECFLLSLGIAPDQFTGPGGAGRVHLYQGVGGSTIGSPVSAASLWAGDVDAGALPLDDYDMMFLGCEEGTYPAEKPDAALTAMAQYANAGGRVIAIHDQYYWLENAPPLFWPATGVVWDHAPDPPNQVNWPVTIDQSSVGGMTLASWLDSGTVAVAEGHHDIDDIRDAGVSFFKVTRWLYEDGGPVEAFSFFTPPGSNACGAVIFADMHVAPGSTTGVTFPSGCSSAALTPQQRALEFWMLDQPLCVFNGSKPWPKD